MKQLIIEACIVNFGDDRGGVDQAVGDIVDVPKDAAIKLSATGRALYLDKKDDPTRDGRYTANKEMVKAAQELATAKTKATVEASKEGGKESNGGA